VASPTKIPGVPGDFLLPAMEAGADGDVHGGANLFNSNWRNRKTKAQQQDFANPAGEEGMFAAGFDGQAPEAKPVAKKTVVISGMFGGDDIKGQADGGAGGQALPGGLFDNSDDEAELKRADPNIPAM